MTEGRRPGLWACGYCHLINGVVRSENAALAGYRPGEVMPIVAPAGVPMQGVVSRLSLPDMIAVAAYAASLPPKPGPGKR